MSNIDPEKELDNFTDWLRFCVKSELKNINTCLPAIIKSYDPETRRASVQIALSTIQTDGESITPPIQFNVPVIFPSSSSYIIHIALTEGDPILLIFSQRGLSQFKNLYTESVPDARSFFSLADAVAIPGFGNLVSEPASVSGISIQTTDGTTFLTLEPGVINLKATTINIDGNVNCTGTITSANVFANTSLTVNGLPIETHVHGGVTSGGSDTGGPQ